MKSKLRLVLGVFAVVFSNYGPAHANCPANTLTWTQTQLFFGRDIGETGEVSDAQWRDFAVEEIIPRFGDGFSVYDVAGYWQGESCQAHHVNLEGGCEKPKS